MSSSVKWTVGWFTLITLFIVGSLSPQLAGTRVSYFDVNNGRLRTQEISVSGRIFRESIQDNDYSILLRRLGFPELPPDWRLANGTEMGLRRWFYSQRTQYPYTRSFADALLFTAIISYQDVPVAEARMRAEEFRNLLRIGNFKGVKDYLAAMEDMSKR